VQERIDFLQQRHIRLHLRQLVHTELEAPELLFELFTGADPESLHKGHVTPLEQSQAFAVPIRLWLTSFVPPVQDR